MLAMLIICIFGIISKCVLSEGLMSFMTKIDFVSKIKFEGISLFDILQKIHSFDGTETPKINTKPKFSFPGKIVNLN